jgi:RHS repeat-associated protein
MEVSCSYQRKSNYVFKRPYGEEIYRPTQGTDKVRQKFTSYERDNETDLDFAQARMYQSKLGRFSTTDPIKMKKDRLFDPQRINLYVYVRNNPTKFIDTTGEDLVIKANTIYR